ncbi:MAG: hypothetical protein AVDCRST_MAG88-2477, partial [uncultured Thermomicrobiales bacterium]
AVWWPLQSERWRPLRAAGGHARAPLHRGGARPPGLAHSPLAV